MLDVNLEFRKGVLFIRLTGELTKRTTKVLEREVTELILKNGMQNIVFNLERITEIDMKGISSLYYHYEICNKQKGIAYICGVQNERLKEKLRKARLFQYMKLMEDELCILHAVAS